MKSCWKYLRILVITMHFTDRNWISKNVHLQNIFIRYSKLYKRSLEENRLWIWKNLESVGIFILPLFCVMILFNNFITNTDVMIFTITFCTTIRASHLHFVSWNKEKKSCFLETKNIFDVTSKTVSRNSLS